MANQNSKEIYKDFAHYRKRPPKPAAKPISFALQQFVKINGHTEKMQQLAVTSAYHRVLGKTVSAHTRKLFIKNGVLFLSLDSKVLEHELFCYRKELKDRLNREAGISIIKEIRFI